MDLTASHFYKLLSVDYMVKPYIEPPVVWSVLPINYIWGELPLEQSQQLEYMLPLRGNTMFYKGALITEHPEMLQQQTYLSQMFAS